MAWLICGTVPQASFPLTLGSWRLENGHLLQPGAKPVDVQRGTPALLAAAMLTAEARNEAPPLALLVGDEGDGAGSRTLYARLVELLHTDPCIRGLEGMTFHYLFPDVDGHNRVLMALQSLNEQPGSEPRRPILVADAGFMYVAKMSGYADAYDLFTPDVGEMAFLADEMAPHPFYTRGFLLAEEEDIPHLVRRAHAHGNCARHLLVKGAVDRVVQGKTIMGLVDSPQVEAMEPIGGTGDLLTGMVTGLLAGGIPMVRACMVAARANRLVGQLADPTPATQVTELLPFIPEALRLAGALEVEVLEPSNIENV